MVGATGQVGRELLRLLEMRRFPLKELRLFASRHSEGRRLPYRGKVIRIQSLRPDRLRGLDLAFFSAQEQATKRWAPRLSGSGTWVVDDSSVFRMDPQVPLVIPEINAQAITPKKRLIAGPNCSTTQMLMAVFPIHRRAGVRTIRMATYQSVSGAGYKAVEELRRQTKCWACGEVIPPARVLPRRIALNLFPQVGSLDMGSHSGEEIKIAGETRRILEDPSIRVSVTAVRVPVVRGHCEALWLETRKPVRVSQARAWLSRFEGVTVMDYPTPILVQGRWPVYVGRLRRDPASASGLMLWVAADNLLKGAALNSVQIAEYLVRRGFIQ